MQPQKTTVTGLFGTPHQYQIPIFQRGYVWTLERQVGPLWADVHERAEAVFERTHLSASNGHPPGLIQKHFLGSVVMTPVPLSFGRVPAFEVIDGQQRLTTLQLLLLAFRQAAFSLQDSQISELITKLVVNDGPYKMAEDRHKIWPTQAGQDEVRFLSDIHTTVDAVYERYPVRDGRKRLERPLMVQAYLYLYHACSAYMRGVDLSDLQNDSTEATLSDALIADIRRNNDQVHSIAVNQEPDSERAEALYMALSEHVQLMTLTLEAEDDPQIIFETLNARGSPLLASDLIRNFVFLQAARLDKDVSALYQQYWSPFDTGISDGKKSGSNSYWREMERYGRITHPRIDLFFYNYTVLRSQEITLVSHVFQSFKVWWLASPRELEVELDCVVRASRHFSELITPQGTGYLAEFARLINALDVSTVTPVYLALRELLGEDSVELKQALGDLASYLVRRAVCGLTTKNYNRFFLKILRTIHSNKNHPHLALRDQLLGATANSEVWPDDIAFKDSWVNRPVYLVLRAAKTRAILRAMEYAARGSQQGSNHVPSQAALSVEHVLPQSWESQDCYMVKSMTDEQRQLRNMKMHSFGNLTILTQPLNSSISNGPFEDLTSSDGINQLGKRSQLGQSALLINTYFQMPGLSRWDERAIDERAKALSEAACVVWGRPYGSVSPVKVSTALTGR